MLTRDKAIAFLIANRRQNGNTFFSGRLPPHIMEKIITGDHAPTNDFQSALHHIAWGHLNEAQLLIENNAHNPWFFLQEGTVKTSCGQIIVSKTLLECAIGEGDIGIIAMIKPYFLQFDGGKDAFEKQVEPYRLCINTMDAQEADALTQHHITKLIDIIKNSSLEEVSNELAIGKNYDWNYKSVLRDALNQFRKDKLAPCNRILVDHRMHCNYANLAYVFKVIKEWEQLNLYEDNYLKAKLIYRQIIGFIQLIELPTYDRYVFAQGQMYQGERWAKDDEIVRTLHFKYDKGQRKYTGGEFPHFDASLVDAHSGLGFDFFVNINGMIGSVPKQVLFDSYRFRSSIESLPIWRKYELEILLELKPVQHAWCVTF